MNKISVAQAAKHLNLTVQSVYAMIKNGKLKASTREFGNFSMKELSKEEVLRLKAKRSRQG